MEASLKDILKTHCMISIKEALFSNSRNCLPWGYCCLPSILTNVSLWHHVFSHLQSHLPFSLPLPVFEIFWFLLFSIWNSLREAGRESSNWHILGRPVRASCLKLQLLPQQSRSSAVKPVRWSGFVLAFSSLVASQKGGLYWGTSSEWRGVSTGPSQKSQDALHW